MVGEIDYSIKIMIPYYGKCTIKLDRLKNVELFGIVSIEMVGDVTPRQLKHTRPPNLALMPPKKKQ